MSGVTLIIDGLPAGYTAADLSALFSPFADVRECRIVRDPTGTSLGFGYVEVTTAEEAELAIGALTGSHIGGATTLMLARWAGWS